MKMIMAGMIVLKVAKLVMVEMKIDPVTNIFDMMPKAVFAQITCLVSVFQGL